MLNGEIRRVRVWYEVGPALRIGHEGRQYFPVALGGQWNPGRLPGQPCLYLLPGCQYGCRTVEDLRIADDSDECQKARPRQAHGRSTTDAVIQPCSRHVVLLERTDMGVHQRACVDEDHRNCSRSPAASTSATSSRLPTRHRPRSAVGVRYRTGGPGARSCVADPPARRHSRPS